MSAVAMPNGVKQFKPAMPDRVGQLAEAMLSLEQTFGCATEADLGALGFSRSEIFRLGEQARLRALDVKRDRDIADEPKSFAILLQAARAALATKLSQSPLTALAVAAALGRAEAYYMVGTSVAASVCVPDIGLKLAAEAVQSALSLGLSVFDTDVLSRIAALGHALPPVDGSADRG